MFLLTSRLLQDLAHLCAHNSVCGEDQCRLAFRRIYLCLVYVERLLLRRLKYILERRQRLALVFRDRRRYDLEVCKANLLRWLLLFAQLRLRLCLTAVCLLVRGAVFGEAMQMRELLASL